MFNAEEESFLQTQYFYIIAVILAVLWKKRRNAEFKRRIQRSRKLSSITPDDQKIIVAMEIQNLFVEYSDRKKHGFLPLQIQTTDSVPIKMMKNLLGYGDYYRVLYERSKIKTFLNSLTSLQNVDIYLYTSLKKNFTQEILKKIGIESYFPEQNRRYCEQEQIRRNEKKHPSWIDNNTRRVMILTPNKDDYDEEDRKYFLVLKNVKKQKKLKSAWILVKKILKNVKCVDDLHAEMDQVNAQIQSDQNDEIQSQ